MNRIIQPELLDTLPPDDPRAIRSRRDLRRINWWMGNHAIMANALKENCSGQLMQITELGAGDGNFLLHVAEKLKWQKAAAVLLDRQKNISSETIAEFSRLGWRVETIVADVFDWPEIPAKTVIANLFLHHFENERLAELLQKISRQAKLFIAVEPQRRTLASLAGKLLWFIGCNDVTQHDAMISIRAGFAGQEISALWPDKTDWQLTEHRVGLFSHLFIARRCE